VFFEGREVWDDLRAEPDEVVEVGDRVLIGLRQIGYGREAARGSSRSSTRCGRCVVARWFAQTSISTEGAHSRPWVYASKFSPGAAR
jgi:hypothetical protein